MSTFSNPNAQSDMLKRISNLQPSAKSLWGKMTVNQMLCHVADPFRELLKIRSAKRETPFFLVPIIKFMISGNKPYAKNQPTSKFYLQSEKGKGTKPKDFQTDLEELKALITKFNALDKNEALGCHSVLGDITREQADLQMWKHLDHHLRQFGV